MYWTPFLCVIVLYEPRSVVQSATDSSITSLTCHHIPQAATMKSYDAVGLQIQVPLTISIKVHRSSLDVTENGKHGVKNLFSRPVNIFTVRRSWISFLYNTSNLGQQEATNDRRTSFSDLMPPNRITGNNSMVLCHCIIYRFLSIPD